MLSQQLQVFLQVADCGSFTKAAKRLLVTPASVMKHINTLESRLGVTLFKRDKRGVVLTGRGSHCTRTVKRWRRWQIMRRLKPNVRSRMRELSSGWARPF